MKLLELKAYIDKIIKETVKDDKFTQEEFEELKQAMLILPLDINIDSVEVKKCLNRPEDFGVFSTKLIEKGDIITLYPVHSYEDINTGTKFHHKKHTLKLSLNKIISGDPNIYTSSYCGHMCNDGAKYCYDSEKDEKKIGSLS